MESLKKAISFHSVLNIVVALFITGASYYHTPLANFKDTSIYLVHFIALQTSIAGGLYFLSIHKWIFRVVFSILFIGLSCFSFWAYTQDVSITDGLIQATLEAKYDIVKDLITLPYIAFMSICFAVLFLLLKWHSKIKHTQRILRMSLLSIGCMSVFFIVEHKRPASFKNRLPFNVFYGVQNYLKTPNLELNTDAGTVFTETDSLKVVFVMGETVRADHLAINGYKRNTTPLLNELKEVISFPYLHTDYTYTGKSVPQILTDKNLNDIERSYKTIFTMANAGGFQTTWLGNQTLEKSFKHIVRTNSNTVLVDAFKSEFSFHKEVDGVLLSYLERSLSQKENKQLITMHMMGSHWWYEDRYPDEFRIFHPVIKSKYVPSNTKEEMINSYDNTLVYLDYFLNQTIDLLSKEQVPTALIYISDHGEMLGKNGKWLHAQGDDSTKNPAFILWFSESYRKKYPDRVAHYTQLKNNALTTDIIYNLTLDVLDIKQLNNE